MKTNSIKIEFLFGLQLNALGQAITTTEAKKALKEIRRVALDLFGGYTFTEGRGGWRTSERDFVEQCGCLSIVQPETETAAEDAKLRKAIVMLAEVIKGTLAQQAIVINTSPVNSQLF